MWSAELHRGVARIELLDELLTSSVFEVWNKVAPFIEGNRQSTHTPQTYQWFEHLVRTLDRRLTERGVEHPALAS